MPVLDNFLYQYYATPEHVKYSQQYIDQLFFQESGNQVKLRRFHMEIVVVNFKKPQTN